MQVQVLEIIFSNVPRFGLLYGNRLCLRYLHVEVEVEVAVIMFLHHLNSNMKTRLSAQERMQMDENSWRSGSFCVLKNE